MAARRPKPQPATPTPATTPRPTIPKVSEPHPAATQPAPETHAATPAPTSTGNAHRAATEALVPFSTRIPQSLRDQIEWLRYTTRQPVQMLVIEALQTYVDQAKRQLEG